MPPEPSRVDALVAALRLPPLICRLLLARGFEAPDEAKHFLRPRLAGLHPPDAMRDLDVAVERLVQAIENGETIMVHGDYDVDGICSTTIMVRTLRGLGGTAVPFIPRRLEDGYDLGAAGVRAAIDMGAKVVITCDCGTSALQPVRDLTAAHIDVIISDHHLPGGPIPECLAVLNPRRPGCDYPDKDLCAAGVAFKLSLALTARLGGNANSVMGLLDLVALATVADVAPLRGENRLLVRYGLKLMDKTTNVGLRALIRSSGLEGKSITAGRIGFILAPRLNAVGRLDRAIRGVDLLLSSDEHEAARVARDMEQLNRERQDLDKATLKTAREMVVQLDLDATTGLVLAKEGWHPGVIGIVASRLVEEFCRPVVMIALEDGLGKGSGRSIPAFDLHGGLADCRDLLLRFGGHRAAAGITIAEGNIDAFASRFNDVARARLTADDLVRELRVDAELPIDDINDELESLLRHFEPFGIGNPSPLLASRGVPLAGSPKVVGQDGLKLRLATAVGELEGIGWGMADQAPSLHQGDLVDIAYRLERDAFRGVSRLVARLVDVRHPA